MGYDPHRFVFLHYVTTESLLNLTSIAISDAITVRSSSQLGLGCLSSHDWSFYLQPAALLIALSLDLLVLAFSIIKLLGLNYGRRTQLVNIILQDGIIYFVVSLVTFLYLTRMHPIDCGCL